MRHRHGPSDRVDLLHGLVYHLVLKSAMNDRMSLSTTIGFVNGFL